MRDIRKIWIVVGSMLLMTVNQLIFNYLYNDIRNLYKAMLDTFVRNFIGYVVLWWPILCVFFPKHKVCICNCRNQKNNDFPVKQWRSNSRGSVFLVKVNESGQEYRVNKDGDKYRDIEAGDEYCDNESGDRYSVNKRVDD